MSSANTPPAAPRDRRGRAASRTEAEPLEREDAARYVAALAADLADLSRRCELGLVPYLLDLARAEAKAIVEVERRRSARAARDEA